MTTSNNGQLFTIARTRQDNLALFVLPAEGGRRHVQVIRTDIRLFRVRRLSRRLANAFARHGVGFLRVEGDVQFDVDLMRAIESAAANTATKVSR